jgi:hypothetical protein
MRLDGAEYQLVYQTGKQGGYSRSETLRQLILAAHKAGMPHNKTTVDQRKRILGARIDEIASPEFTFINALGFGGMSREVIEVGDKRYFNTAAHNPALFREKEGSIKRTRAFLGELFNVEGEDRQKQLDAMDSILKVRLDAYRNDCFVQVPNLFFVGDAGGGKSMVCYWVGELMAQGVTDISDYLTKSGAQFKPPGMLSNAVHLYDDHEVSDGRFERKNGLASYGKKVFTSPELSYEFKGVNALEVPNRVMLLGSFNNGKQVRQLPSGGDGSAGKWTILATGETSHLKNDKDPTDVGMVAKALLEEIEAYRWYLSNVFEIPEEFKGTAGRPVKALVANALAVGIESRGEAGWVCNQIKDMFKGFKGEVVSGRCKEFREGMVRAGGRDVPPVRELGRVITKIIELDLGAPFGFSMRSKTIKGYTHYEAEWVKDE